MTSPKDREPTSAMVEVVARAIAFECDIDPDVFIGMHGRRTWEKQFHAQARAAIRAMMVTASLPVDHGRVEKLVADFTYALGEDGHEPDRDAHCGLCVVSAEIIEALTNKDTASTKEK